MRTRPFLVWQGCADAERERTLRQRYGFSMDYKDISERIALLTIIERGSNNFLLAARSRA
ncbi:MAG: hypothetical protein DMG85_01050 [Acidobacteria bacterium]|nr:MAG: hypothetical protein DMG85_01050 [Acidobacteriota bacterium]